jgi:asparagine synthase (glutamine-hydrolysing)
MCGISALFDADASPEGVGRLLAMHRPIRHRGPDGEGFLLVSPGGALHRCGETALLPTTFHPLVGLAFRRLRILDLSEEASQPMSSPDGSCWIVFNGEIYNFRQLRDELSGKGRRFRTSGDTEVLLAAYEQWGTDCFARLDGMWSAVLLDLRRRRLVGSRDRFGIKPLYWSLRKSSLLLSSEIRQILAAVGERPRANVRVVENYLRGRRAPVLEDTFFEGVRSVPPATWFEVPIDGAPSPPQFQKYWDLAAACRARPPRTYGDALEEFGSILTCAVASHRVADVTVGSLLSGGLDSAVLTSLLSDLTRPEGRESPSFSFGFREAAPRFCELSYVDAMVRQKRLLNFETTFDSRWMSTHSGSVIRSLEEPPLGIPALAQYRVFELCRAKDCTVVLDGEGADEVLAGYPYHQRLLLMDRLRGRHLADFSRELRAIARRESRSAAAVLAEYFLAPIARRASRRDSWLSPRSVPESDSMAHVDSSPDPSLVNRRLYFDLLWGNAKLVLSYTDKSAMAHSVEARVPYFDRRLVEFAFSLPDEFKVGNGDRKRILRDAARALVPGEITERADRMGFGTPDGWLLRGEMWPLVKGAVLDGRSLGNGWVEPAAVRRFVGAFETGAHDDARSIWRLFALATWREEFHV